MSAFIYSIIKYNYNYGIWGWELFINCLRQFRMLVVNVDKYINKRLNLLITTL